MFERLAVWYLVQQRGRYVLPRCFVGMILGMAVAERVRSSPETGDGYLVNLPYKAMVCATSNTIVSIVEPEDV